MALGTFLSFASILFKVSTIGGLGEDDDDDDDDGCDCDCDWGTVRLAGDMGGGTLAAERLWDKLGLGLDGEPK